MIAALTFLPAMLGFVGPKILSRRQRRALAADGPRSSHESGFWVAWSKTVERHPVMWGAAALAIILLLAVPFFSLRLGSSDQGNDAKGTSTRTAYDLLAKGFGPGFNGPLQVVAVTSDPAQVAAMTTLSTTIADRAGVAAVTPPATIPAKDGTQLVLFEVTRPRRRRTRRPPT